MSTTTVGEVRTQVSNLVVAPATDELVGGLGALEGLRAKVMEALVALMASGGHEADGFGSAVSWLRALCARHHGTVHRHGWDCTVDPDGTVHITRPDRTTLTAPPPTRTRPPTLPVNHPTLAGLRPEPPSEPPPVRIDEILAMRDVTDDPRHHALARRHEPPDHTSGYRVFYVHPAVAHVKLPSDHPDHVAKDPHGNVVHVKSPHQQADPTSRAQRPPKRRSLSWKWRTASKRWSRRKSGHSTSVKYSSL